MDHGVGIDTYDVVVELTERSLASAPAELLRAVASYRERGWRIALDDVGAASESLALMPLLRPDVVKLDMALLHDQPSAAVAQVLAAVWAEVERDGATLLAEGIETAAHKRAAIGMGATLGQGWAFGHPSALAGRDLSSIRPAPMPDPRVGSGWGTPMDVIDRPGQVATKPLLVELSKHLEEQAVQVADGAVVLASFQHDRYFTRDSRRRYQRLARSCTFVAALGEHLSTTGVQGVRGAALAPDDPLVDEWDILVLGPHYAGALLARDLGDEGPEAERRFEYHLTFDRRTVVAGAETMMSRVLRD